MSWEETIKKKMPLDGYVAHDMKMLYSMLNATFDGLEKHKDAIIKTINPEDRTNAIRTHANLERALGKFMSEVANYQPDERDD
jgi:hypothetical protein